MKSFTFNRTLMIVFATVSALFIGYTPTPTRAQEQPPGRVTKDRPDEAKGSQIHIVYAIPSDGADQQLDVNGSIVNSVNSWNNWLADKSGGFRVRIDTFQGQPDITFVRLRNTEAQLAANPRRSASTILSGLYRAGLRSSARKKLAVYYGGAVRGNICGIASTPGPIAIIYLPNCEGFNLYTDLGMLHEIFHTLGAVNRCAKNDLRGHVTDNGEDLMSPGGKIPTVLDANNDDYWGHGKRNCQDISKSPFLFKG
jgi:hypothetical protein